MWFRQAIDRAAAHAEAIAVSDERRALRYGELRERALRLAGALQGRGVRPGDRVALLSRNRVEAVEALIALSLTGAVVVPLNHRLTAAELGALAAALGLDGALGEGDLLGPVREAAPGASIAELGGERWEGMAASGPPIEPVERRPEGPELVLLTSGTTSRPRGAVISSRAVEAAALSWLAGVRPSAGEVYFSCTPLFHSTAMIAIAYLGIGAHLALVRDFTPQRAIETIERRRATQMYMVPSMLALTLRARGLASRDFSSLREVFHGGAPIEPRVREAAEVAFGARLRDCYGQAQAGGPIAVAGLPLPGVELRIDGAGDAGAGEVRIRSAALMSGYLGEPQASAEALEEGWLRTGDLGRIDARGALQLVGRIAETIIRGGQNVYPAEVEEALAEVAGVEEAAVIGVPDEIWGEVPVAAVVPRAGAALAEADLAAHCRRRLAPHKRPVAFDLRRALPRNAAGKVQRPHLREAFAAGAA
ncbi:MAG TPA: AMP-binding protein [Solirubrobacterales bacterium]|nr:AMP-binding protein [Solirubrobacterales bacterium]